MMRINDQIRGVWTDGGPGLCIRKEFLVMKLLLHQTQKCGIQITSGEGCTDFSKVDFPPKCGKQIKSEHNSDFKAVDRF